MMRIRLFPGIVFGLLGLNACIVGTTVYLAHSDRSFAVEPDYYQKALSWDQTAAQDRRNAVLGWKTELTVGPRGGTGRAVCLRLKDSEGGPVAGAAVDLIAFHSARAGQRLAATLSEISPGLYQAALPIERSGAWEFRLTVRRGTETFTASLQQHVGGGS
jgi:nitrogen fixation protein FixH